MIVDKKKHKRFWFGKNWKKFLLDLSPEQIEESKKSLASIFGDSLKNKTFIDVGCGSGLSSLAAMFLGARVHSFDYDEDSVGCCRYLKKRFFQDDKNWIIQQGSVLDETFLMNLGKFDIVYSYGVLHHTGNLHKSLNLITKLVNDKGYLYLTLYNDQGRNSIAWHKIKKFYVNSHLIVRRFLFCIFLFYFTVPRILLNFFKLDFSNPFKKNRGMKLFFDMEDWLGGYPFEVSKPGQIVNIYKQDYTLEYLNTVAGNHGNNEFLFKKKSIKF